MRLRCMFGMHRCSKWERATLSELVNVGTSWDPNWKEVEAPYQRRVCLDCGHVQEKEL